MQQKRLLYSAIIFLVVVAIYLLGCPEWFFDGDDWGLVFKGAHCSSLKDFFDFFIHGKLNDLALPIALDNHVPITFAQDSFFSVYYRPLPLIFHFLLFHISGLNAYGYFVVIIALHAAITALIFFLLSTMVQPLIALLCSLHFAFHPTLYGWLGKIDTLQNQFNLLMGIILLLVLKKSLECKSLMLYIASCMMFFLCLLTRETLVLLPLIIFFWLPVFVKKNQFKNLNVFTQRCIIVSGFCLAILFYLSLRGISYPLTFQTSHALTMPGYQSILNTTQHKILAFVRFFYDFFWLQWFPWTAYAYFKNLGLLPLYTSIKMVLCTVLAASFITNTRKWMILALLVSAIPFCWPPAYASGTRLFYEALPFCIAVLAYVLNFSTLWHMRIFRYSASIMFSALILFNASFVIAGMHHIMREPKMINASIKNLKEMAQGTLHDKPLLLITSDSYSNSLGVVQAIQMLDISTKLPQYFFGGVRLHTKNSTDNFDNFLHTEKSGQKIRIISSDSSMVWFEIVDRPEGPIHPDIDIMINGIEGNHIFDMTLTIGNSFFHPELVVLVWFFEQKHFVELT